EPNVIFSDGNAAAGDTRFYRDTQMLNQLPWNIIWAKYWNDFEDGRRIKCAEILVHPKIAPNKIQAIFCCSQKHSNIIITAIQRTDIIGMVDPDLYF
ncbi:DarT ssDNA thymidine ADP-ribosyltransferase family protein, partial [Nodularia sp. UHCC 0506]|uniref:DarT ssDNA thymidine ADP-ribosyltransferase family protein n=1 Tax=Nodularia sp. UHCC 0506 TaxID=3110243 RepID=UPI002B21F125